MKLESKLGVLCLLLGGSVGSAACGEDPPPPPPPPPTELRFVVTSAADGMPLSGAEITLLTDVRAARADANGRVVLEVAPGRHEFRAQAAGHVSIPEPFVEPPAALAVAEQTVDVSVSLEPRPGAILGGMVAGSVLVAGAPAVNALVVASATDDFSTYTDREGRYRFLGLPPNLYRIAAYVGGHGSEAKTGVAVTVGSETEDVDLELTPSQGARIGGRVGEGTGSTTVSVALVSTGDPIPGLSKRVAFGSEWSIDGVPEGQLMVRAFLEKDGRTLHPDLIRSRDEPVFRVTGSATVAVDLPTAPAIEILSPTSSSSVAATVVFSWTPVAGADFYVVEVRNVLGQVLWGGFDAMRRPVFRVLGRTTATYGEVVPGIEPLTGGRSYRVRVYAGVDTLTGTQFELIAASEELDGRFSVAR